MREPFRLPTIEELDGQPPAFFDRATEREPGSGEWGLVPGEGDSVEGARQYIRHRLAAIAAPEAYARVLYFADLLLPTWQLSVGELMETAQAMAEGIVTIL